MPYNLLLHKKTRESVGIKLEGNIVIIDEAHNLLPTIESIHSASISGSVLFRAQAQLNAYLAKYNLLPTFLNAILMFSDYCCYFDYYVDDYYHCHQNL